MENTIRAVVKRKRVAQSSLNWDDPPEAFIAFKERAPFMAGFVQGAEYLLNDVKTALLEEETLRSEIKEIEKSLKRKKT